MSDQKSDFIFVFFGILVVIVMLQALIIFFGVDSDVTGMEFIVLVPIGLMMFIYVPAVAISVYRDAKKRGLDPWLWASIATFVPAFIGIVIYLVVRSESKMSCINCGNSIRPDFKICPFCGHHLQLECKKCHQPVVAEWKACPRCGEEI